MLNNTEELQRREEPSAYSYHWIATSNYPSFAKLPLIYLAKTNSPEYPKNYFKSYCKDVLILAQLAFHLFFAREIVLAILLADQEVKPIEHVLVLNKECLIVILTVLSLLTGVLHEISIEPVT